MRMVNVAAAQLGPDSIADGKVSASLGGPQTLLGQQRLPHKPGRVVGQYERRLRVVSQDRSRARSA